MELKNRILIDTNKGSFYLRPLFPSDVSKGYVDGLNTHRLYIENIPEKVTIETQKIYLKNMLESKNDTILGFFDNHNLIGTTGVQQSYSSSFSDFIETKSDKVGTLGIFLFSNNYRGEGIAKILIWSSIMLFFKERPLKWFGAGMYKNNIASYKSFLSCGFKKVNELDNYYKVLIDTNSLIRPEEIQKYRIKPYERR